MKRTVTTAEFEHLGIKNTADFREALKRGEYEKAISWLRYIIDHQAKFPQYLANIDWFMYRGMELREAKEYGYRDMEVARTKEEAIKDLEKRFLFYDTAGFQKMLRMGLLERAKSWLDYILANKPLFPQYHMVWNIWKNSRLNELNEAMSKKK